MPAVGSPEWLAEDKGAEILISCWVSTLISSAFVLSRVYVNGFMRQKLRSDDWFIITGQVCFFVSCPLHTSTISGQKKTKTRNVLVMTTIAQTTVLRLPGGRLLHRRGRPRQRPAHGGAVAGAAVGREAVDDGRLRPRAAVVWAAQAGRGVAPHAPAQPEAVPPVVPLVAGRLVPPLGQHHRHLVAGPLHARQLHVGCFGRGVLHRRAESDLFWVVCWR